jgi:hypothetical protein
MQSSLPAEPIDRNIKAADVAEIGDIAKIVETATRTDAQSTTWKRLYWTQKSLLVPPPTITRPIVVQRFPSLERLGWGFILAFRPGVLSARMWKRGSCPTKTLVLPRRLYRTRDRCAVPKTLLQCVGTRRRNCIGRLSSFSRICAYGARDQAGFGCTIKLTLGL